MEDQNLNPEDQLNENSNNQENNHEVPEEQSSLLDAQHYGATHQFVKERELISQMMQECGKVIIGQTEVIEKMFICLLSEGHVLLEGVPGIAKTLSARTLAHTIATEFNRIQFTPDLMPADITGTSVFNLKTSEFTYKKGPLFSNLVLIDEINRAPAKTQSALFEAMEEKQISFDGVTYSLEFPFMVIATQNPVEQEGTYRLPEAQLDRFMMKIVLDYPSFSEELMILNRYKNQLGRIEMDQVQSVLNPEKIRSLQKMCSEVSVEETMLNYITKLVHETRNNAKIYLGASPRASLSILKAAKIVAMMAGRSFVIPDDIQYIAPDVLNHRIILSPEAEMARETPHTVIDEIIKKLEVPR